MKRILFLLIFYSTMALAQKPCQERFFTDEEQKAMRDYYPIAKKSLVNGMGVIRIVEDLKRETKVFAVNVIPSLEFLEKEEIIAYTSVGNIPVVFVNGINEKSDTIPCSIDFLRKNLYISPPFQDRGPYIGRQAAFRDSEPIKVDREPGYLVFSDRTVEHLNILSGTYTLYTFKLL